MTPYAPHSPRFVYGTSVSALTQTANDNTTLISSASGRFSAAVTSLAAGTTYYYKAVLTVWDADKSRYVDVEGAVQSFTTVSQSYPSGTDGIRWMELPAFSSSDGEFHARDISNITQEYASVIGSKTRNYSFCWSDRYRVSVWVAYPMYADLNERNVTRKDNYAPDPLLDAARQPAASGYSGSYSRGHQIPSHDRLSSREANNSVFYMTNIAPQDQTFNGGLWGQLETKVSNWAGQCDTLYVVTGCVCAGSTRTTTSNGLTVTVPSKFYKALLRLKGGSYTACAFIYDHFTSQTKFDVEDAITVRALEQETGINFFANLPAMVGETKAEEIETTVTTW